jgi:tetratricopeptide (TPR) repeat protein
VFSDLAYWSAGRHPGVVFVADDLNAWLITLLADAGRRKLAELVLGTDQERALRSAGTTAVRLTAAELLPDDDERAGQLAMVISEVFGQPVASAPLTGPGTLLENLRAGVTERLAVLDDASLTGTGISSAGELGIPAGMLGARLTGHLVREIVIRGSRGGPLFSLASQLNDDVTHLQGQRLEAMVGQMAGELRRVLTLLESAPALAAVQVALAELPPEAAGFTGRDDELAVLAGLLAPAGTAGPVVVSAVAGLPGVGKTALAVEAGHEARKRGWFAGGVLFVDMHGYDETPVRPEQALDALLRALGVPAVHMPPLIEERASLYRSVLAQSEAPVLVIIDNASSEAQVQLLLPGTGPHKVLITSRRTMAAIHARLVDITVLDDAESVELLNSALRAARPDDDRISGDLDEAGRLAGICGGLPLALQIVAAVLKADPVLSVGELGDELGAERERLGRLRYDNGGPARLSVAAAFDLSYRRLDEIPARLFRLLPIDPAPAISTGAAGALADLPASEVRHALSELAQAHLLEPAPGVRGRWRMHDLVRLYAQRLSDYHADADGQGQARDRLLEYYLRTASAADLHVRALPGIAVPRAFADRETALGWLDAERTNLVGSVSLAAGTGRDQIALDLANALVEYFNRRRRFDDLLPAITIGLEAARRLGDRHGEGMALNHLGLVLTQLRRFDDAIAAHQAAAAIFQETGDQHSEGMAQFNLGMALSGVRRFDDAIAALRKDLQICSQTGDRHGAAKTLDVLGGAYRDTRAFDDAIAAHQAAAAIFRETGDQHGGGIALINLATAFSHVRQFDAAITTFDDAEALLTETGDKHDLGMASTSRAMTLLELRRFDEAITACQDARALLRETGDRHGEGNALNNLSIALRQAHQPQEAIAASQDAAAAFREIGDKHGEAVALDNLGVALREAGRAHEAITASRGAAIVLRETGDRHGEGMALYSLGLALSRVQRLEEATTAHRGAIAAFRETSDWHGEGLVLINLGSDLLQMQRFEEAIAAHQSAAGAFRLTGDRHGEGDALGNLSAALGEAGRPEEAITVCQDSADIFQEIGDRHALGAAQFNLGLALQRIGRTAAAITAYQEAAGSFQEAGDRDLEAAALRDLVRQSPVGF